MQLKNQQGVAASTEWLLDRGLAAYNEHTRSEGLDRRVTEPITFEHFLFVVDMGRCLACEGVIHHKRNRATGGDFHICQSEDCGWYIGYSVSDARGYQVKL